MSDMVIAILATRGAKRFRKVVGVKLIDDHKEMSLWGCKCKDGRSRPPPGTKNRLVMVARQPEQVTSAPHPVLLEDNGTRR